MKLRLRRISFVVLRCSWDLPIGLKDFPPPPELPEVSHKCHNQSAVELRMLKCADIVMTTMEVWAKTEVLQMF